jgi:flagellar protein FliO/FliZ
MRPRLYTVSGLLLLPATPAIAAGEPAAPSTWPLLLSLVAVVAVILIAGMLFKRLGGGSLLAPAWMRPVAQLSLGARERLVVIDLNGKWLVLGVTSAAINLLTTIEPVTTGAATPHPAQFAHWLERFRNKNAAP